MVELGSGETALLALGEQAFDLVLADIQMPGMTGVELLQGLLNAIVRARSPDADTAERAA